MTDEPRSWTSKRLALMDCLARDPNVTDLDVRLFWLITGKMSEEHGRKCWASRETLAVDAGVTVDAISRSAKRLCSGGYLRKVQDKDFRTSVYSLATTTLNTDDNDSTVVPERPQDQVVNDSTVAPITTPGSHNSPSSNSLNESPIKNTKKEFDQFWEAWPRKVGKANSEKAFLKALKKTDFDTIFRAAKKFAQSNQNTETQFIPHAATWLNGERWTDEHGKSKRTLADGQSEAEWYGPVPTSYETPWRNRLIGFRDNGFWLARFGPKPGEPDCGAPMEIMIEILGEPSKNCINSAKKQGEQEVTH